jgi:hypothetical protein
VGGGRDLVYKKWGFIGGVPGMSGCLSVIMVWCLPARLSDVARGLVPSSWYLCGCNFKYINI